MSEPRMVITLEAEDRVEIRLGGSWDWRETAMMQNIIQDLEPMINHVRVAIEDGAEPSTRLLHSIRWLGAVLLRRGGSYEVEGSAVGVE